jgi:hypothetical protein
LITSKRVLRFSSFLVIFLNSTFLFSDCRYSPFELGIADWTIHVNKGCYTGQEIVAGAIRSLKKLKESGDENKLFANRVIPNRLVGVRKKVDNNKDGIYFKSGSIIRNWKGQEAGIVTSSCVELLLQSNILPRSEEKQSIQSLIDFIVTAFQKEYQDEEITMRNGFWNGFLLLHTVNKETFPLLNHLLGSHLAVVSTRVLLDCDTSKLSEQSELSIEGIPVEYFHLPYSDYHNNNLL